MTHLALLNNVEHKDLRVLTRRGADLGDAVMTAAVFTFEFRNLQNVYPILFQNVGKKLQPTAVFGFQNGENLFLEEDRWKAGYLPAMIRRGPFVIGYQRGESGQGDAQRVLSINLDHPRISTEDGEALFQPLGGRTPYLEGIAGLMETIFHGMGDTDAFVQALEAHELLEPVNFEITLNDGSRNQLIGFYGINEDKLRELPGSALESLSRSGYLMPIFMALASLASLQRLVDLKNATLDKR